MNEGTLKIVCGVLGVFLLVSLWGSFSSPDQYDVNVTSVQIPAGASEGLDLRAVGELVKTAKDAEALERQINDSASGLNNLDLDSDGEVDYISVEEFGGGNSRGFMLVAKLNDGREQEVATIDIEKTTDSNVDLEIRGNERVYGANHYHHSSFGIGDYLMLRWLFGSHSMYRSPYYYGRYPGYYSRYRVAAPATYRARTARATRNSSLTASTRSQMSSGHASKVHSQKTSLRKATTSKRSFQARASGSSARSGGFGRPTTQPSARSSRSSGGSRGGK
jgi:hypothetical protein